MSDELRVVVVGSLFESTPEGLHLMDRIRRNAEIERMAMEPWERELHDKLDKRIDMEVGGMTSRDQLDQFFEEMLRELLAWRENSAWEQSQVDAVEEKWREKWAELRREVEG